MVSKKDINVKMSTKCNTQDLIIPKSVSNGNNVRVVYSIKNSTSKILSNYTVIKTIGKGNFAKVKLARHKLTKKKVAIKIMDKTKVSPENLVKLFREVKIIKLLHHPNIVKLYEVLQTETTLFLVMEYVSGGELFDYLVDNGKMKECIAREKFRQIVSAIQYCHSQGIVHRDIKAENLLLDELNNVKIVDFGFSNEYSLNKKLDTFCGSPPYAAPELFLGRSYIGPEVDIWSLGVILYTIVTGSLPFDGRTLKELKQNVLACHLRVPFYLTSECDILLRKMIARDPKKRKPLDFILKDKWINLNYEVGYHLRPFTCIDETYDDVDRINKMVKMGIDKELIHTTLQNKEYNHLMATYLILNDNRLDSNFVNCTSEADELLWKMHKRFNLHPSKTTNSGHNKSLDNHLQIKQIDSIDIINSSGGFTTEPLSLTIDDDEVMKPSENSPTDSPPTTKDITRSKTFTADSKRNNRKFDNIKYTIIHEDVDDASYCDKDNNNWTTVDGYNVVPCNDKTNSKNQRHHESISVVSTGNETNLDKPNKYPHHRNTINVPTSEVNRPKRQFSLFRYMKNPFKSLKNGSQDSTPSADDIDSRTTTGPMENQVENDLASRKQPITDSFDSLLNYNLMMSSKPVRSLLTPYQRKLDTKDIIESVEKIAELLVKLNINFKHQFPYKLIAHSNWNDYIIAQNKIRALSNNQGKSQVVCYSESNTYILFEIEINRIIFNNIYAIRLKRINGGSIYYKEIAACILNSLDFVIPRKK